MAPTLQVVTASPSETRAVGAALAPLLAPRDLVSLGGDLGAGKTTFVQGAAAGLGVAEPVTSPAFVLVREYRGAIPVVHVDVYRLNRMQEVLDLGFEEYLDSGAVMFVEWGDVIEALFPQTFLAIEFTTLAGDERRLSFHPGGPAWAGRWERLEQALDGWAA
ncbi:MAG TPA: tRNA (adenosine(37)-N6)-threonylcarbamoyltransferase complex ATPase subunit type 1 TsaE [Actinomycetota bacterium]|nr:tRNA (adenosine(37)-N6)-threonylcarbamoyltransferase complex ATPase subunit type 1 TsaE [Actinomycetota bacterium]